MCVHRGSKYFKVVSDWLALVSDLYRTILVGGPLWTQFDDAVIFFGSCFPCLCATFALFLPHKQFLPLVWGPLVLIIDF